MYDVYYAWREIITENETMCTKDLKKSKTDTLHSSNGENAASESNSFAWLHANMAFANTFD